MKPKFEFSNVYIQQYTRENLKCYEGDGMPTYYGQLNHKEISRDPEKWLNNIMVINLDIINNEFWEDCMVKTKKEYKTITSRIFKSYSEKKKEKTMNCVVSTGRKDLWV